MWEEAAESHTEHQPSTATSAEWSETAEWPKTKTADMWEAESEGRQPDDGSMTAGEDAWREEEKWAEDSQPSGPYTEEQRAESTHGDFKAYESELTHPNAASTADEQAWEERTQGDEPVAEWEASGEQPFGEADYRQEWPADGSAAAEEWYDDGVVRNPVMDEADSTKQAEQEELKEDAAAWIAAEDGK